MKDKKLWPIVLAGALIGAAGVGLFALGNPANMGFCIACFLRDTAGALKLHTAPVVQYLRPEIIGIILGSFCISLLTKEFKARGGSSPLTRLFLGFIVMVCALVFLGCPLRMFLRMGAGDLNAWIALIGFVGGVYVGTLFLGRGFSLGRAYEKNPVEGVLMPGLQIVFLCLLVAAPTLLAFSEKGPGSQHAAILISLVVALAVGILAQKSRLCQMGAFRDLIMLKDPHLLWGSLAILLVAIVGNLIHGSFKLSMVGQPIAHSESLWNILSMFAVGLASTFLGGCPMRQLVLTGTGNVDSGITVIGMVLGAAFAHNFKLASGGEKIVDGVRQGGTTPGGRIMVIVSIVALLLLGLAYTRRRQEALKK